MRVPPAVAALASGLTPILRERLVGVYLGGSFSMGDFVDASSDYDFLVVVEGDLTGPDLEAIAELHQRLVNQHRDADRLEGDYAPRHRIVPEGTTAPVPGVKRGRLESDVAEIMLSADNIANLRSQGVAVYGPPASAILPTATPDDVRAAVVERVLDGVGECATELEAASELLNLARSLRALETGQPTTKTQGAEWALARLDVQWHPVIQRALAVRRGAVVEGWDRTLRSAVPRFAQLSRTVAESDASNRDSGIPSPHGLSITHMWDPLRGFRDAV